MRIDKIEAYPKTRSLTKPYSFQEHVLTEVTNVTVRLTDDQGRSGIGETLCPPLEDTDQPSIMQAIVETYTPAVLGLSPFERATVHRSMEDTDPGSPFARAAIDLALHDLVGKILSVPSVVLLGGACQKKIPLVGFLPNGPLDQVLNTATELRESGVTTLKLGVGDDPERDLEFVAKVRETVGPEIMLRIAGNEKYSLVTATEVLRKMEEYGLELIEQPLSRTNLDGLAELCTLLDTPVMTTWSLGTPRDAIDVIAKGAANVLGINSIQCGGLQSAMRVAHMAQAASLPICVVGLPVGSIGTSADLQLASVTSAHGFAAEIPGPDVFSASVFEDPPFDITSAKAGFLMTPDEPGLGA